MSDKKMPKCRYCGGEMIMDDWYGEFFYYYCKECKSCSPDAKTEEEAYQRAIMCPPVVHGRWIHDINNLYGCSVCLGRETMSHKKLKKHCPNCGAKMDEPSP